ncbi:MAG TPA: hypothetical protein VHB25_21345 [Gemmatimonadaceae bacterium]|nr:hypothetical protein [Gemmatimonadaceae bacterium]
MQEGTQSTIAEAAIKGALAGLAGGIALMLAEQLGRRTVLPENSDTTSTAARAVELVASEHETSPSRAVSEALGGTLELTWCAALGAAFGIVHSRLGTPAIVDGLALAALAYTTTASPVGVLPRIGMSPPQAENMEEAAIPIASHVAFGVATAAVFEAVS